ncbi:Putative uncharacterized protein Yba2 [Buchnera aphidicola (Thelaxes suberi)]|uniref:DUF2076 domain-containing protein n=1 Tax=Buchnera aphidicola TaxID=9 RepID=UPI0034639475
MHIEEKKLIEDLFERVKKTADQFPEKNTEADNLINNLVKHNPNSIYYIIQTLLVHENIVKKLNNRISELEKKIVSYNDKENSKPSFLSGLFGSKVKQKEENVTQNIDNKVNNNGFEKNSTIYPNTKSNNPQNSYSIGGGGVSSFLGNAAQTAAGIAGGMVIGNMITDFFHSTPNSGSIEVDRIEEYNEPMHIHDNNLHEQTTNIEEVYYEDNNIEHDYETDDYENILDLDDQDEELL